ncbi:glycosyltransferase family 4 protein [Seonamhaeicola maritimus]|uniref:glycosyltransferase family 4 protein n=1 Tax=Seonamhaeicola maritimus TaxID=2591822 RepID=UPI002494ECED|nr:glycosyltransferase family 4 protein [Seonamhaeicola maritimus]
MKNILYIGNKLKSSSKSNITSISILGSLLENQGYDVRYSSSRQNKIIRLLDMLLTCFIHKRSVDFVIIDTYSTWNFYYAVLVSQFCRLLSIKYILRLNGGNLPNRLKNSPKLSRLVFSNAYEMISPSFYLTEIFKTYGYNEIVLIPNAINLNNYEYYERSLNNVKLLWVRSFSKIYNPELAVKVLKTIKAEGFQAELCMVGPDSDGSLEKAQKLADDLRVEVKFTGKLTKESWIELSKDYNIFINTTNFDNMPVSVVEAMALGLPVVSTNVGGMPYLIENGVDGILVNPDNVNEFVDAIKNMISDSKRATQMTVNARAKVEQFDWSHVKKLWDKVLN